MPLKTANRIMAFTCILSLGLIFIGSGISKRPLILLGLGGACVGQIFWLIFGRCPGCGSFLGPSHGKHCPHCGEQIDL